MISYSYLCSIMNIVSWIQQRENVTATKISKESKLLPNLIFWIEKFETTDVIKLAKQSKVSRGLIVICSRLFVVFCDCFFILEYEYTNTKTQKYTESDWMKAFYHSFKFMRLYLFFDCFLYKLNKFFFFQSNSSMACLHAVAFV